MTQRTEQAMSPAQAYKDGRVYEIGLRYIRGYSEPDRVEIFTRGRAGFFVVTGLSSVKRCFSEPEITGIITTLNEAIQNHLVTTKGVQLTLST